jgi:hypothetical protein
MLLFSTAGGGGEVYELCCFCPTFVGIIVAILMAIIGFTRGSVWASIGSLMIMGFIGTFILLAVATLKPSDDPDEKGGDERLYTLLWWWICGVCISLLMVTVTVVRRWSARRTIINNNSALDAGPDKAADSR